MIFISPRGELIPLSARIEKSGCIIQSPQYRERGRGITHPPKISDKDYVACIGVGNSLNTNSVKAWGGGLWADITNSEPSYGETLLTLSGFPGTLGEIGGIWDGDSLSHLHTVTRITGFEDGNKGPSILSGLILRPLESCREISRIHNIFRKSDYQGPFRVKRDRIEAGLEPAHAFVMSEICDCGVGGVVRGEGELFPSQVALGIRLSLPPFPMRGSPQSQDLIPNDGRDKHLWLMDVSLGKAGIVDGDLGWATARGSSVREAKRRVYRTIENTPLSTMYYRKDIG